MSLGTLKTLQICILSRPQGIMKFASCAQNPCSVSWIWTAVEEPPGELEILCLTLKASPYADFNRNENLRYYAYYFFRRVRDGIQ
jgi:hypothetical protein